MGPDRIEVLFNYNGSVRIENSISEMIRIESFKFLNQINEIKGIFAVCGAYKKSIIMYTHIYIFYKQTLTRILIRALMAFLRKILIDLDQKNLFGPLSRIGSDRRFSLDMLDRIRLDRIRLDWLRLDRIEGFY